MALSDTAAHLKSIVVPVAIAFRPRTAKRTATAPAATYDTRIVNNYENDGSWSFGYLDYFTRPNPGHPRTHIPVPVDAELFECRRRSVRLNPKGQACLEEVQRILAEVHGVSEQQRTTPRRVRIVSVEAVAEKWLLRRLASFKAAHPGIAIELETKLTMNQGATREPNAYADAAHHNELSKG